MSKTALAENDSNLNVFRYLCIHTEEVKIDLNDVNERLVEIDKRIKEARDKHNGFLAKQGSGKT